MELSAARVDVEAIHQGRLAPLTRLWHTDPGLHPPHAENPHGPPHQAGAPAPAEGVAPPRVAAWEVTRNCNLSCAHCRASAVHGPYEGEFSTEERFTLVDQIASFARPILILTGGVSACAQQTWCSVSRDVLLRRL